MMRNVFKSFTSVKPSELRLHTPRCRRIEDNAEARKITKSMRDIKTKSKSKRFQSRMSGSKHQLILWAPIRKTSSYGSDSIQLTVRSTFRPYVSEGSLGSRRK